MFCILELLNWGLGFGELGFDQGLCDCYIFLSLIID